MYNLSSWKQHNTRNGNLSIVLLLAAGSFERTENVQAEVVDEWFVRVKIIWPLVLNGIDVIT